MIALRALCVVAGLLVIWQAVDLGLRSRRPSCCRRRSRVFEALRRSAGSLAGPCGDDADRDRDRPRRRHRRSASGWRSSMSFLPPTRPRPPAGDGGQPGDPGLRHRAAAGALVRLRPRLEDRHGDHRDLLPGRLRLPRRPGARPTPACSTSPGSIARGRWQEVRLLRMPGALPALVTGLRLAAVYAPIGALIGEWVGASSGLGYAMLLAKARAQTDVVFAASSCSSPCRSLLRAAVDLAHRATSRPGRPKSPDNRDPRKENAMTRIACSPAALALLLPPSRRSAADKLTVLLDWFVNPDHAPLVIAKEGGYFARHGLDVELIAPADPSAPPRLVAAGQADIAVTYQPDLMLQIKEGLPLVRFGTLIETPLNCLIVLEGRAGQDARRPQGQDGRLFGRRASRSAYLGAMLEIGRADDRRRDAGQRQLQPVDGADVRPGRCGDRRLPQFRADPARASRASPASPSIPEEHGVPPYDELIYVTQHEAQRRSAPAAASSPRSRRRPSSSPTIPTRRWRCS